MIKIYRLSRKKSLEILKNEIISEIKDEEIVNFLVLSISNDVHDLVPLCSTEQTFKDSVREAIVFWRKTSKDQNFEKLKEALIEIFVKKTSDKFFEFTNKIQGLLSIASLIFSTIAMFRR